MSKPAPAEGAARVLAYLRSAYGIADATAHYGSRHPYVELWHNGKRCRITINPDARVWGLKRQDIARLLGPPPTRRKETAKRTLSQLTAQLESEAMSILPALTPASAFVHPPSPTPSPASPTIIAADAIRIGVYTSDKRHPDHRVIHVSFLDNSINRIFPDLKVYSHFKYDIDCSEIKLWISETGSGATYTKTTKTVARVVLHTRNTLTPSKAIAPSSATMVDGKLCLVLAAAQPLDTKRQPLSKRTPASALKPAPTVPPYVEAMAEAREAAPAVNQGPRTPLADDLRAALTLIAELEQRSAYRLTRVRAPDGTEAWEWRAPTIRL